MEDISYYDVLGVKESCTQAEIQKAFRIMSHKHHPDKGGDPELAVLINKAYSVLKDPSLRKEYDHIHNIKQHQIAGFDKLKQQSKEFYSTTGTPTTEDKTKAEKEFKKLNGEANQKIGFNPDDVMAPNNVHEFKKKVSQIETQRDQEEIEFTPDKIFDGSVFEPEKFNAAFDKYKSETGALTVHTGNPLAYDGALVDTSNFSNFDDNSPVDSNTMYSSFNTEVSDKKITRDDVKNINIAEYTKGHNKKSETYENDIKQLVQERNAETQRLYNLPLKEYNIDSSMGGYGITEGIKEQLKALEFNDYDVSVDETEMNKKLDRLINGYVNNSQNNISISKQ